MAQRAAGQRIERCRSANGQTLLYNPQVVPTEVVDELQSVYGYNAKGAAGCLADIMISQLKGEFPPVAFMLVTKLNRHLAPDVIVDRLEKAQKAFKNIFIIVVGRYPRLMDLQMLHLRRSLNIKIFPAQTPSSATRLMMIVHEKHSFQLAEKAKEITVQMNASLLTREHAMSILRHNLPFLSADECDMLLDIFGTLSAISQASAAAILDATVLNADAAHAIEEFFRSEYVVE